MRSLFGTTLVGLFVAACGSHDAAHGGEATAPPESVPIAAITGDAVYVVNGADASISVVEPGAGRVLGTIALKNVSYPHHINLSPDRTRLAVAVPGHDLSGGHGASSTPASHEAAGEHGATGMAGAVLLLDATTGATIKARRLAASNHNAAFSPDGREIWTAQLIDEGTVLVLDAATLETKQTIRVGKVPAEVTFAPDGKYAFVANGTSNDVTVIDVASKATVKTIAVDREPVGAWPGADGMMYVDCESGRTIKAIDPKTLEIVRTYNLGFAPGYAAVPPTRTDELWLTDVDAGRVVFNKTSVDAKVAELPTAAGTHAIAFAPDGTVAFVTNQLAGSISIIDTATRTLRSTIAVGAKPNGIVFRSK